MAQTYLNAKQEQFARFLAEGYTQVEAHRLAGYEPSAANASTLAKQPLVKDMVMKLRAEHERKELEFRLLREQAETADPELASQIVKGAEWTFQRVMDMMAENVRLAQVSGEYKAANECLKMMGESMKMFDNANAKAAKDGNEAGQKGTLALIGQVTNILAGAGEHSDQTGDNPIAPRLQSTGRNQPVE